MAAGSVLSTHHEHGQHGKDDRSEQSQEKVLDPGRRLRRYVVGETAPDRPLVVISGHQKLLVCWT
jgi:hypothetical protein